MRPYGFLIIIGLIAANALVVIDPIATPSSRCSSDGKGASRFRNAAHGPLHLGHLVGALRNWAALQDQCDCLYFVADWHALTSEYANTLALVGNASTTWPTGLPPASIPSGARSSFSRSCPSTRAVAAAVDGRAHSVARARADLQGAARADHRQGPVERRLPGYPLLQTADIAMYDGGSCRSAKIQVAHLELSREAVRRFNQFYGEVLVEPQPC